MVWVATLLSVFVVSLVSFVGLFTFGMRTARLQTMLIYFISFAAGALFGDAFLHLIPEIVRTQGFGLLESLCSLGGIVLFLVLEKGIHLHQFHSEHAEDDDDEPRAGLRPFVFTALAGDAIHNFGDGLIIGASYLASVPIGLATSFAVAFHEIPHEIGNFGILVHGGLSRARALLVNFLTALVALLGALLALALGEAAGGLQRWMLPIAAGGFIYVAGSDLIPELHRESDSLRKVLLQLAVFIAGILLMASLLLME